MRGLIINYDIVLSYSVRDKLHIIKALINYFNIRVALSKTFKDII